MSFAAIRSGEPIHVFNGKDYPYCKDKMKRNIMAINSAAWQVVLKGVTVKDPKEITPDEAKLMGLDSEVWVFITNHLTPEKYHEVKNIPSAKGVWDYLEKIGEGVSTQKDARIDTLRSKFYRFKRNEGEKVSSIYSRLTALANELISLGADDITPHSVVRTLLRSLDDSFDHIVLMIKERTDFRRLVAADILERLNTFEMEEEEKCDINGSRRRSHALKAKASHHSSPEVSSASGVESDDPASIGKDLALIMRRFNRFQRKGFSSLKKSYSSRSSTHSSHRSSTRSSPSKDNCCYKCKKPGHYIADCPLWEAENKAKHSLRDSSTKSHRSSRSYESKRHDSSSRRDKKKDSDDDKRKKYHKKREGSSSKTHSSRRSSSHRAKAYLGKVMNSEAKASGSKAESGSRSGSGSESHGVAGLAFASADASTKVSSSFFTNNSSEDESPAYCFMAKSKVSTTKSNYDSSDCSSYESDAKISYGKLAKIASIQQDELDSLSRIIKKSETLLIDEMEKGQTLTNEHAALKEKFEELSSRHDLLSVDYEKLTYEFLQRKMALEKLKEAHEELENVNISLMAQQGSEANDKTDSPCLTCLERSKTISKGKAIVIDDTNASDEENPAVTEELLRLKNLFESGMFKCVQGHQYLCDILRKALLHRNPRNDGVGFERKMNPDGTYWEPGQYPKTVWVLAKGNPIDIANLSGFDCKMNKAIVNESLDSDYKLIKDEQGKVTAEYVGTPPKNGFYKRQIWVKKALVEKLPANHTMQGKSSVPPNHFYSLETINDPLVTESNVPQKQYYCTGRYTYRPHDNNTKIAYAHSYPNHSQRTYIYGVLDGTPKQYTPVRFNIASTSASTSSQSPSRLWVVKKN